MPDNGYAGILLIGDPHLEGRQPGFRKDDYPNVILDKLAWCLNYAASQRLLPALLGDIFDKPQNNPNRLIERMLRLLQGEVLGVYGNHDVHYHPELTPDDSLSLLVTAGRIRLVSEESPWRGTVGGRPTVIGGSSYRQEIPERFELTADDRKGFSPLVIWLTHHDILVPGYDEGRLTPRQIDGIDLVINGHIHRKLDNVQTGKTLWLTPGNISRRSRNDASREHVPAALRIDVSPRGYQLEHIHVPHRPFEEVFHEVLVETSGGEGASAFVAGLAELQARRTASGAGLKEFLQTNLDQFEPDVRDEILNLAQEVMDERPT